MTWLRDLRVPAVSALLGVLAALAGCAVPAPAPPPPLLRDGELTVPADYRKWPVFLDQVQRPDLGQVRDIFINPLGATTVVSGKFPFGTRIVMEIHAARMRDDGRPVTDDAGMLVKDRLLKIFVMGKGQDWGSGAPEGLANGDWIYAAYLGDGRTPSGDSFDECRRCHLPNASVDYIHRYEEYFTARARAGGRRF